MVWVTSVAAVKFVLAAAEAVTTQLPEALNVTTPLAIEHVPVAAKAGVTPDDDPVTVDTAVAVGVYVPPDTGEVGTVEANANV